LIAKFSAAGNQSDQHVSGDARTGATSSTSTPTKGIASREILSDWSVVCYLAEAKSYSCSAIEESDQALRQNE
jgi:hypothetical protein